MTVALELARAPDESGRFTGYAAVFGNVDLNGDIIEPGAFTKTLQEKPKVPILWQHVRTSRSAFHRRSPRTRRACRITGQLTMEVPRAREARALMAAGALTGLSIGYETKAHTRERADNPRGLTRRLTELALWEFSPVTFPANDRAGVVSVKQSDHDDELIVALRELLLAMRSEPKGSRPRFVRR